MIHVFLDHIQKNKLWEASDRLLLAVSGGRDSMALLHVCNCAGFALEVAHVNYGLRGEASDLDQQVVEAYCAQRDIPCHVFSVPSSELTFLKSGNLQKKARDIRYRWLEQVRQSRGLDYILTAHHAQDQTETLLWHLMRGTGVRGLGGISAAQGQVRRPFLSMSPETFENWLRGEGIHWREDASNLTTEYTRNKIRHHVLPELHHIRPGVVENMAQASDEIQRLLPFLSASWLQFLTDNVQIWGKISYLKDVSWIGHPLTSWMLSWWLKPLGFTNDQLDNLRNAIQSSEMKVFTGRGGFTLWANRDRLWFAERWPVDGEPQPHARVFDSSVRAIGIEPMIPESAEIIPVDAAQLRWPVTFRTRQSGDRMRLRGGRRKISDLFIDQKVPAFLRNTWPILVDSTDEILWIPGIAICPRLVAPHLTHETVKFYAEPWIFP